MHWLQVGPTVITSFMASLVEFVEALTVVLAVGTVRGWRHALMGSIAAVLVLCALVLIFGQSLSNIPLTSIQLIVGTLIVLFGLRWLRKAILRAFGIIPLHDESLAFAKESSQLKQYALTQAGGFDKIAFLTAFKIVMLEGVEVIFIVIALGASGNLLGAAIFGAAIALLMVVTLGLCLHRPLSTIPENALKFGVGILLAAFGTFWVGEGISLHWPTGDWTILLLIIGYFLIAQLLIHLGRTLTKHPVAAVTKTNAAPRRSGLIQTLSQQLLKLFIDDTSLAIGILIWIGLAWLTVPHLSHVNSAVLACIFWLGLATLLSVSVLRMGQTKRKMPHG